MSPASTPTDYMQQLLAGELQLLQLLATGAPLAELLEAFVKGFESGASGVMCSVLLLDADGQHLRHGAAPSLPAAYCAAIDGAAIGPAAGSCGTAAFRRQTVIVQDIATDPLWADYCGLALAHGLRACWSVPVLSAKGQVLGTFANYHTQPRAPSEQELVTISRSAYLLGLFMDQHRFAKDLASQQQALRESEARYRTLVEWSPQAVLVHREGLLIYVNAATVTLLRAGSAACLLGRHISEFVHPDYRQMARERGQRAMQEGTSQPPIEEQFLRLDGSVATVEVQSAPIQYDGAAAVYVVAQDLSKRLEDQETIHHLAFYDALTDLPNRRLMTDRLQHVLRASGQQHQFGALLLLDLDDFKQINDLAGREVGDALLKQVAQRLQACVCETDSVARVGGDEFMVLLETFAPTAAEAAQHAEASARKITDSLGAPYTLLDACYICTPSIGIVVFRQGSETRDSIIKKADAAMYQAKAAGRNTLRFFDPAMQAQVRARAEFEADMHDGLERHEFTLHYQIQVDAGGKTTGVEALVRWASAKHGLVQPGAFIALAEENGLILALGQRVLQLACQQLVDWAAHPLAGGWSVAVNVSARQFAQSSFVEQVAAVLAQTGANPQRLKLELTESMLVHNVHEIIAKMNAIKAMGVSFSLDDFGTGYSSLSYLKQLPLAQLKIDQSFVRDLLTDPNDSVIARTIVALGHSLGMRIIAEGVETEQQRQLLQAMGCDAFQGYYFGRPVPPAELLQQALAASH